MYENQQLSTIPPVVDKVSLEKVEDPQTLSLHELHEILYEIEEQPSWRNTANKEMDYADGNQLSGELMQKQRELGLPPAIENLIGPKLREIQGYEASVRTDWRVKPNGENGGQDVADALNYKINQAESNSRADQACSDAFASQIGCGIGWVEVAREQDAFEYPYRCDMVDRNEMHWDMTARKADLSDGRWVRRSKWFRAEALALAFPEHKERIIETGRSGTTHLMDDVVDDGYGSTGLGNAWGGYRASTINEERWYNPTNKELCVFELWYKRWESVLVLETPDGRVVEYDEENEQHVAAVASGIVKPKRNVTTRIRRSYWLGPLLLSDEASPYAHKKFPYVPFFGFRENTTGVPFGYIRDMIYPQDSLNSGNSKLRWGMSVTRIERTEGATDMTDAQLRAQAARPDADIVLNQKEMAKPGARFEIIRDYTLTDQHYQMLRDNRETIERSSGINMQGGTQAGNAQSGYQESLQIERSNQSLSKVMDNFRAARRSIGELLLSMIIQDLGDKETAIVITGDAISEDRQVIINKAEQDPITGVMYRSNDVQRTRLMVALEDVPSTSSYQSQQLAAMSEVVKVLPKELLPVASPYLVSLMDMPNKAKFIEDMRKSQEQKTPEQWEEDIKKAVEDALTKAGMDIKQREVDIKERKSDSEIKEIEARAVQIGVQAAYSAMQAGGQIVQMPQVAPIADEVMKGAGYQVPTNPMGQDPNFPTADMPAQPPMQQPVIDKDIMPPVEQNTSPAFPPVPQDSGSPMQGIETPQLTDNI